MKIGYNLTELYIIAYSVASNLGNGLLLIMTKLANRYAGRDTETPNFLNLKNMLALSKCNQNSPQKPPLRVNDSLWLSICQTMGATLMSRILYTLNPLLTA